jgi:NDP-sugar pyrophosphorylase family protein
MKAIIMAGGEGKRLAPYTHVLPKPLLPLGDRPILEILLRHLHRHGIREVVLAVNHLHHLIQAFFGDGKNFGLSISYLIEDRPLGTCGPLAGALDQLGDHFLVANGDLLTTMDVSRMLAFHQAHNAQATVASYRRHVPIPLGVLTVDAKGRVSKYDEKPTMTYQASMGLYVFAREAVRPHVNFGQHLDMPCLIEKMIDSGREILAFQEDCLWLDVGQPEDYEKAQSLLAAHPENFL